MKQIIVLAQSSNGTEQQIEVAFWFSITSGAATQANGSAWSDAVAAENTAIQNGSVREEIRSFTFPVGEPPAAIKATLQQAWTERNAQINGVGPHQYYGVNYDPTVATNGGWSA